jgi:hypothetical protein
LDFSHLLGSFLLPSSLYLGLFSGFGRFCLLWLKRLGVFGRQNVIIDAHVSSTVIVGRKVLPSELFLFLLCLDFRHYDLLVLLAVGTEYVELPALVRVG